jgi:uncharacterized protein YjdB
MITTNNLSAPYARRLAALLAISAVPLVTATGQTIGLNAGATGNTVVAPNAKLTVPIIVDLSSAGALNIAALQASMTWGTARLTLDSIRPVVIPAWTFIPNTAGAAGGSSIFAAFGENALPATSTIANAFFTASASTGGTRVMLAPMAGAVSESGASVTHALRPRALDVCVGTAARWGDVNNDGIVNISDAQQIGRFSVGLSIVNPAAMAQRGDVTADGVINISDAQQVARFSVGLSASPRLGTDVPIAAATTAISVSPGTAQTIVLGSSRQVVATPVNGGTDLSGCATVVWGTSNAAVASVNSSGYVTALSAGSANITATSGGFTSQVAFNVTSVPVASVTVGLGASAIQAGTTTPATATMRDAANNVLVGRVVAFSSGNTAIATVNATTGVVTGVAPGTATIFATSEGITGSANVTVTAGVPTATVTVAFGAATINPGANTTATATARDAGNNILGGKVPVWSSSNTGVATVNPSTGVVTGVAGGTANIIATIDGIAGQAPITVNTIPVATVSVSLGATSIAAGATTQVTATARDAANNVLPGRIMTFTSNNNAVATVGAFTGIVTGVSAGTATIFATTEGITGQVIVTVTAAGSVASIQVALGTSSLAVGAGTTSTATLRDAGNNIVSGPVTWSSSAPSIATINATTGAITGVAAGQATIVATSGSVTGMATLTTSLTPVATVTVTMSSGSILIGGTSTGTAVLRDANGNVLTGRTVTWSTDGSSSATVNATTGVYTGVSAGTMTTRATSEGRIGTGTLTINTVPVSTVTLTLASGSISVGGTTNSTVVTRDANNNILTGRSCTFSSSSTSRATVTSGGVVTGVSAGTSTITATCEGRTGTATVTVTSASVASVTLSLSAATIGVGGTGTASAVVRDAGGNALTGRVVTFTSSNTAVATVNSTTGALTGVAAGTSNIVATSEGVTGSATLTVGTVLSFEPSGMSVQAERPFNCVKPTACESSWYYGEDYANAAISVLSADAPRSAGTTTSGNVVQQNFTPSLVGGSSPASLGTPLNPQRQTLYLSMWMKMSPNYEGHPSNVNKIIHFYTRNGANIAIFTIRGAGMGTLVPAMGLQNLAANYEWFSGTTRVFETVANLEPNVTTCTVTRGVWNRYEMVLKNNTPGVADGTVELWMNGTKCLNYTAIMYVPAGGNNKWEEINWSPTYGGGPIALTSTFFTQADHIYVSGK